MALTTASSPLTIGKPNLLSTFPVVIYRCVLGSTPGEMRISMSALLRKHIPDSFSWEVWTGTFDELKIYLEDGFAKALLEFESNINQIEFKEDLKKLVEYLCHPFPEKRGHPRSIVCAGSNYNLERFVTLLDVLKRKAELIIKN